MTADPFDVEAEIAAILAEHEEGEPAAGVRDGAAS